MKKGRKLKLTKELVKKMVKLIRDGLFYKDVCKIVGIGETTFYRWMNFGERGIEPFLEFRVLVQRATAKAIIDNVKIISDASEKDWRASAWILEKRFPELWGEKKIIEIKLLK